MARNCNTCKKPIPLKDKMLGTRTRYRCKPCVAKANKITYEKQKPDREAKQRLVREAKQKLIMEANQVESAETIDFAFVIHNLLDTIGDSELSRLTGISSSDIAALEDGVFTVGLKLLNLHLDRCPKDHKMSLVGMRVKQ